MTESGRKSAYKYDLSIVTAVCNMMDPAENLIQSVIAQDHGLEHIQLILVDCGSTDGSGEICDRYQALYPRNIFVIHQNSGSVSSARNAGMKLAEGEFLNFPDSGDHFSDNAVSEVMRYIRQGRKSAPSRNRTFL